MADPAFTNLRLVHEHAVATITLDRPKRLNALDVETLRELARAIRQVRRDAGIRVLVVASAGEKAFSAGADISAMMAMSGSDGHAYSRLGHDVLGRLEALPIPVIAAVDGVALGGGLELALACDLIVASERARFGQPEINLGLIPGFGGTQRLVRRIGQSRARELVYLGHAIAAEEAVRIGLVARVVPTGQLDAEVARLAAELAAKPPLALAQAKRATAVAADADLETGCRYEVEAFGVTFATEDRIEGLTAFTRKRRPVWKGR